MKRPLAITTAAALALSLAACGADMTAPDAYRTRASETVTATDTMHNSEQGASYGTGTNAGASTTGGAWTSGTGVVAGAMNRAADDYRYGTGAPAYTARNNGGYLSGGERADNVAGMDGRNEASGRYRLMLENGRVHDTDGYLLDGENAHYHTW